ncbi:MAG: hypothetical protein E7644_04210 [Ruminococcaceae bacterium]|nr:hypothetical protein [Oscillospiraceae bacterium]
MNKKNLLHDAKVQALIVALVAVVFLILIFFAKDNMVLLALWISLCLSAFIISGWILASGLRDDATHFNYFLYDQDTKKSISEKELNFEFVNGNLTRYLSNFVNDPVSLWDGFPASLREKLQKDTFFRAPVVFRMLYELSLLSPDEILHYFGDANEALVSFVCRNVEAAGDKDMAQYIFSLKRRFGSDDQAHVVNFFQRNKRCFEGRIMNYIKRNLNRYVMKK